VKMNERVANDGIAGLSAFPVLEWVTTVVLVLVLAALAWMPLADILPSSWHLLSLEAEILGVLGLLTGALVSVSVLALLHTRNRHPSPTYPDGQWIEN
jgi:hypothetical protein